MPDTDHTPDKPLRNVARSGARARAVEDAVRSSADGIHREFIYARNKFDESLDALRQIHGAVLPHVAALDEKRLIDDLQSSLADLTREQQAAVISYAVTLLRAGVSLRVRPQDDSNGTGAPPVRDDPSHDDDSFDINSLSEESSVEEFEAASRKLSRLLGDKYGALIQVFQLFDRARVTPHRQSLIRGLLLTSATSAFEVLFGSLVGMYYSAHPQALGDEPRFSLSDLESFASIADAREEAISRRVDAVLHGDLDDWAKWLQSNANLNLSSLTIDHPTLVEIFQRRHVIMHWDGRASRLYRRRLIAADIPAPELGTRLPVDGEYLDRALDELQTLGALLTVGMWAKSWPEEEAVALHGLYLQSYDLMLENRWLAVEKLCSMGRLQRAGDDIGRTIFQVNEWLAIKRQHGREAIEDAVRQWDTSALQRRFRFAKHALLDEMDSAFPLAHELLQYEEIDHDDLSEWPLLDELREDPRYQTFAAADEATTGD